MGLQTTTVVLPRTARTFHWIAGAVLLLVGSLQLCLWQQYFNKFDPLLCDNGTCTGGRALSHTDRLLLVSRADTSMPALLHPRTPPALLQPATAAEHTVPNSAHHWGAAPPSISRPKLVVVVSSAPRSGSSFLGELLSSPKSAAYFFEPFWYYKNNTNKGNSSIQTDLFNLLTCRLEHLPPMFAQRNVRSFIWRKPKLRSRNISRSQLTSRCLNTTLRVAKTIRPRLAQVLPLLQSEGVDVHVVHLVRDPRAIMNSLLHRAKSWPERRRDAAFLCDGIRADVRSAQNFTGGRFTTVRYEDLVSEPLEEARRLFDFLRLPLASETATFIESHVQSRAGKEQVDPGRTRPAAGRDQLAGTRPAAGDQKSSGTGPETGAAADGGTSSEERTGVSSAERTGVSSAERTGVSSAERTGASSAERTGASSAERTGASSAERTGVSSEERTGMARAEDQREGAAELGDGRDRAVPGAPGGDGEGVDGDGEADGAQRQTLQEGGPQPDGQLGEETLRANGYRRSAGDQQRSRRFHQLGRLQMSRKTASTTRRQRDVLDFPPFTNTRRHLLTAHGSAKTAKRKSLTSAKVVKKPTFRRLTRKEYQKVFGKQKQQKTLQTAPGKYYFGTVRGTGFDQLHWIKELPPAEREKVERACGDVLQALDYPLRYPEEVQTVQR